VRGGCGGGGGGGRWGASAFHDDDLARSLIQGGGGGWCFTLQAELFIWSPMKCESSTCWGLWLELGATARRGEGRDLTSGEHTHRHQTDMFRRGETCPEAASKRALPSESNLRTPPLRTGSL
jgi:hypothetical protein